jgi:prephenate dehydrogenase
MNRKLSIGIIGGTGGMGRWFDNFFSKKGHRVLISGRKTEITNADIAKECNVIVLSVPLEAAMEISGNVGPLLHKDQILMDLCSLKETIVNRMTESTTAEVVGTHPLFGPFTDSIKGQNVILCPGRGNTGLKWIRNEYESEGAVVTVMDPDLHDRHMAVVQGLTHFMAICFGRTLQKMNMDSKSTRICSTPVFRINHDLVGRLFAQDMSLYRSIINNNKHFSEVYDVFLSSLYEGANTLSSGCDETGLKYLENIREFFKNASEDALQESNKLIKALYSNGIK